MMVVHHFPPFMKMQKRYNRLWKRSDTYMYTLALQRHITLQEKRLEHLFSLNEKLRE